MNKNIDEKNNVIKPKKQIEKKHKLPIYAFL